jgi:hypothetical protein
VLKKENFETICDQELVIEQKKQVIVKEREKHTNEMEIHKSEAEAM